MKYVGKIRGLFSLETLRKLSLAQTVVSLVLLATIGSGLLAGQYARSVIYENKMTDTWAILFLEAEALANRFKNELGEDLAQQSEQGLASIWWDGKSAKLSTDAAYFKSDVKITSLGYENGAKMFSKDQPKYRILSINGAIYLTFAPDLLNEKTNSLFIKPLSRRLLDQIFTLKNSTSTTSYIATKEGKLIHTNSGDITELNFAVRPLVQRFIASPLSGGLQEFTDEKGMDRFGFFLEIPATNLIFFSEAPQSIILDSLAKITKKYLVILALILVLVLVGVSLPISRITAPLSELARVARAVGAGHLNQKATLNGYGEVASLGDAFNTMIDGLNVRDREIGNLMIAKTEKIRLEAELKVAQGIQSNLLPQIKLPVVSGLKVSAEYHPATECAGDWYHYHYNASGRETIFIVVDVSGHGAGSSMFTALIAGAFDQFCDAENGSWDIEALVRHINKVVYRFGKGVWHATMLVARYRQDAGEVDIVSAGHTPSFVIRGQNVDGKVVERISLPSSILGHTQECVSKTTTVQLQQGDLLFLYSDGFTEAKNPNNKVMSARKLEATLGNCKDMSPESAMALVERQWKDHRQGEPALDDACLVMVKVA